QHPNAEWWDPFSDRVTPAGPASAIVLDLAPYESRVLVCSENAVAQTRKAAETASMDISSDWKVTFPALKRAIDMHDLRPWTADEPTRFLSGQAVYEKAIDVPAD